MRWRLILSGLDGFNLDVKKEHLVLLVFYLGSSLIGCFIPILF